MKLQEFVDAGYYINLDYKTGRRAKMEQMLAHYGWQNLVSRISAAQAFDHDVVCGYGTPDWKACVAACATSHAKAVRDAKEKGYSRVLILEDDAAIYEDQLEPAVLKLERALESLSKIPEWDVFLLGSMLLDNELEMAAPGLIRVRSFNGAHAYILNAKAFDAVLRDCPPNDVIPYDHVLLRLNAVFSAYPIVAVQAAEDTSSIGGHACIDPAGFVGSYNKPIQNRG